MKNMRQFLKPVGFLLAVFMFMLSGPCQSAMAAMIETESVVDGDREQDAREYLKSFLAREDVRNALVAQGIDPAEAKAKDAEFKKAIREALNKEGYPAKADPAQVNYVAVLLLLVYLVILVTMVYGPIAAMLVEMFPTRIRYTSMSLPYHIGNGWFGGLLPTISFALVAQNGNIYYGLWYPIIIAAMTLVIGTLFIRETKDVDIYARD